MLAFKVCSHQFTIIKGLAVAFSTLGTVFCNMPHAMINRSIKVNLTLAIFPIRNSRLII